MIDLPCSFYFPLILREIFSRAEIMGRKTFWGHPTVPFEGLDKIVDVLIPDPFGNFPYCRFFTDKQVARLFNPPCINTGKWRHAGHPLEKAAEIFGRQPDFRSQLIQRHLFGKMAFNQLKHRPQMGELTG